MWSKGDPKQNRSEIRAPSLEQFTVHSQKKAVHREIKRFEYIKQDWGL
jgi:hypothetical protein